jgi:hypothetical protein
MPKPNQPKVSPKRAVKKGGVRKGEAKKDEVNNPSPPEGFVSPANMDPLGTLKKLTNFKTGNVFVTASEDGEKLEFRFTEGCGFCSKPLRKEATRILVTPTTFDLGCTIHEVSMMCDACDAATRVVWTPGEDVDSIDAKWMTFVKQEAFHNHLRFAKEQTRMKI